jgi:hypothetical protein
VPRLQQMMPGYRVEALFEKEPILLSVDEVQKYCETQRKREGIWNNSELEKQTVYYEDMFNGVAIRALNLFLDMKVNKQPYDYSRLFANYEEIKVLEECLGQ